MQRYISFNDRSPYKKLRLLGYYGQRLTTSRRLRRTGTLLVRYALQFFRPVDVPRKQRSGRTHAFRKAGYLPLGQALTERQCRDIHAFLADRPLCDSRGTGRTFTFTSMPAGTKLADYSLDTAVDCPHVLDLANSPEFITLAKEYLGYTPTITNLSLRWSFPSDRPADEVQSFHRDSEVGTFKILVYLTDVDLSAGPHVYVTGTHQDRMPVRLRIYSDDEIQANYPDTVVVTGVAGTAFAIDTKGIHKGVPPLTGARLLLGVQYSLLPCLLYDYAPIQKKGSSKFDSYINRLILSGDEIEAQH